ncbi:hypothetical protein LPB140_08635 [Sphingorhabdus lutea]|uniref:Uncharacterized protein n=1 Tax=Sphingorhabdus lutea TaxID=1913578 RepID=A0A1L3JCJ1_9SPHN|nr:Ppx/GppA family phosphatase [Sphingorhabdus lutea]APG62846.1 hypothetical protein LPB140_08635 [Sphingorhabdus lutea]
MDKLSEQYITPEPRGSVKAQKAIIDVGSNSVRLVIYGGPARAPNILFNEKILAGLGASLDINGKIGKDAMDRCLRALARFKLLALQYGIANPIVIATAAVRDAKNGHKIVEKAASLGIEMQVIGGEDEAYFAAMGILSSINNACGMMGDLGGGSLELAILSDNKVHECVSMPLGVLRLQAIREGEDRAIIRSDKQISQDMAILEGEFSRLLGAANFACKNIENFYMVGGSWRALMRLYMLETNYPLPIMDQFCLPADKLDNIISMIAGMDDEKLGQYEWLASMRAGKLYDAALMLKIIAKNFGPKKFIVSTKGIREGILYNDLSSEQRYLDPLLESTADVGNELGRFPAHGQILDDWVSHLFIEDGTDMPRLRLAAANLCDVAWRANPDFRSVRGVDIALHGNWTGVDVVGREVMAQAVYSCFGGDDGYFPLGGHFASDAQMNRATGWGLAFRLAQRLSGGAEALIRSTSITLQDGKLFLFIPQDMENLIGESIEKRLGQLANFMQIEADIIFKG